ncbi:MAG: response regulator [Flavobacteriales bacterium]|nr:response regulator [Flavobacteriales bacterium]
MKRGLFFTLCVTFVCVNYAYSIDYTLILQRQLEDFTEITKASASPPVENFTLRFSKIVTILSIALISILSLLSLTLYKNNVLKLEANKALETKNEELRIAKEKAEKASKAKDEFLSTVSHELRTPLNAIIGITHIMMEDAPKKAHIDYLNSLKFSGEYLRDLINDILEINRIESDKIHIEKELIHLPILLQNIVSSFKNLASQNNNHFYFQLDPLVPKNIVGDNTKLSQILINLVNNALKFTKNGSVEIQVHYIHDEAEKMHLEFRIIDTGIGIPDEKQEEIFERFSQASTSINRKYGGTGLGLAIVKKLTELLQGNIRLKSKVNQGSTFYVSLPFDKTDQEAKLDSQTIIDENILKGKHILVVEDNAINQMVARKMLEKKGIKCTILDNAEAAIEHLKDFNYDLVLMDVHLPGINGDEATLRIRNYDQKTPIIALTAITLEESAESLLKFQIDDVITKPFNPANFYKTLAYYLVNKR